MKSPLVIRFRFYWPGLHADDAEPDYLVIKGEHNGLREGMNICTEQIAKAGVPIPPTPTYQTWLALVAKKVRCGKCWKVLRGASDYQNHLANTMCGWNERQARVA